MAHTPNLLERGEGRSLLLLSVTQGWVFSGQLMSPPPLIVRASPSLAGTGTVPTCEGEGSALPLPQPWPWVTVLALAGTLPIILLTMQNPLQPFLPCGAACQPQQQSHAGNWALGRSLLSAVTTYTRLKIHPPSRKANPERCLPCQGFQQWSWATCR